MSFDHLPPRDAPLTEKIRVAMSLAGYSQKRLAFELGTDRRHVGRWANGKVLEIRSAKHQQALAELLGTPRDYWVPQR